MKFSGSMKPKLQNQIQIPKYSHMYGISYPELKHTVNLVMCYYML